MINAFFTNTIWYVALAVTSATTLVTIFVKTPERKKTFAFCFTVLGFAYFIEMSLLIFFNAYTYYPRILPSDPFYDAVLGNIFSQVSISSSAVLICVFGLSNWWLALFSVVYFLIDVLFVHLGIYEHFWYRSVFTLGGFFVFGVIVKYWYKRVFSGPPKWIYYPTLFFSVFAISANLAGTIPKLLRLRSFQSAFYSDPSKSHTLTALIYVAVMTVIMIALRKWRTPQRQKIFVLLLLLVCQWGLLQSGVIAAKPGWGIAVILYDLTMLFGWTVIMDRCMQGKRKLLAE